MRAPFVVLTAVILVSFAACQKSGKNEGSGEASETPDETSGKVQPAEKDDTGGSASTDEVRAPTADDLSAYTEGLGEGELKALIQTSMGDITCTLAEKGAPLTVANFVGLARGLHPWKDPKTGETMKKPFYDGLIFHRVIPEFMIQGGDPEGQGTGGPGYKFATEVSDDLGHDKPGTMSMANAGRDTNGSQFFITEKPVTRLDGSYNVFGYCDNIDVVEKIARVEKTYDAGGNKSRPVEDVVIKHIEIFRGESPSTKD